MCDETQHGQFVALRALQEKRTDVTLTSVGGHPIRHVGRLFYASFVVNSPDSRVALKPIKKQSSRCISAACPGARRCASTPLPTSVSSWIFFLARRPPASFRRLPPLTMARTRPFPTSGRHREVLQPPRRVQERGCQRDQEGVPQGGHQEPPRQGRRPGEGERKRQFDRAGARSRSDPPRCSESYSTPKTRSERIR